MRRGCKGKGGCRGIGVGVQGVRRGCTARSKCFAHQHARADLGALGVQGDGHGLAGEREVLDARARVSDDLAMVLVGAVGEAAVHRRRG